MAAILALPHLRRLVWRAGVPERYVDDVAQEVLIRIWRCGERIDALDKPAAWIRRVITNAARDLLKSSSHRREVLLVDDDVEIEDECPDPEERAFAGELLALVKHLLEQIDPARREILADHELLGKTLPDIAAERGISVEAVKDRLDRARQEITAAGKRWDLERDRRRRWGKLFAFLPPWPSTAALFAPGAKVATAILGVAALVAGDMLPVCEMRFTPQLPAVAAPAAVPAAPPTPSLAPPGDAAVIEAVPAPSARPPRPSSREEVLIGRARTALDAGDALDARRLLDDHEREFPRGPLAPERRRLRQRLP